MERADRDEGSGASERVSHRGSGIRAMLNNLEVFSINHEAAGKIMSTKNYLRIIAYRLWFLVFLPLIIKIGARSLACDKNHSLSSEIVLELQHPVEKPG